MMRMKLLILLTLALSGCTTVQTDRGTVTLLPGQQLDLPNGMSVRNTTFHP